MLKAHDFSKACRGAPPSTGDDLPSTVLLPTVLARRAVRELHTSNAAAATQYLRQSKVGEWANHHHTSTATNNSRVLDGFDWYVQEDAADGRPMKGLDATAIVTLGGIDVETRIDVVLDDGNDLAGRVVLWDGPEFDAAEAETIACPFAHALQALYPGSGYTTIGVWQARRQYAVEVPHAVALAATPAAIRILAAM